MRTFTVKQIASCWILTIVLMAIALPGISQTITGTVFRDYNANGTYQAIPTTGTYTFGEPGVGGVTVTAYNAAGAAVATTTSSTVAASMGTYTLTLGNTNAYRLEFTYANNLAFFEDGYRSTTGTGTSVQFVNGGTTGVNFGISAPTDFCQTAPPLVVPCYVSGDPLVTGTTVANEHVLVQVPYTASGANVATTSLANANQIGSVWGMAFQRETKKLFSAAFLKRHVGLGTGGLGGIYVTTTAAPVTNALYVDLENAPFNLDLGQSAIAGRVLPGSSTTSSNDPLAFDNVGKVGLGSMDMSSDGKTMYIVDLKNRQLLALAVGNPAKSTFVASDLTKIAIPDPGCTNGVARPFAVTTHNGKIYVGVVCTGESTGGSASNLFAYVYAMNEGATTIPATPVFSFRLNYTKGRVHTGDAALGDDWETWTSDFSGIHLGVAIASGTRTARPQPMLSDISFTDNGDMLLAFADRGGHQLGYKQRNTTQTGTNPTLYNGYIGGDLLRANYNGTAWVLERNGIVGSLTGEGTGNGQGPGTPSATGYTGTSGEFYDKENYVGDNGAGIVEIHQETIMGSALSIPGLNQTVSTTMDPINVFSGGFTWFNNRTGDDDRRAEIFNTGTDQITFGKANGLGLIKALCAPAPIQIGNRVWNDLNNNGVQDPGEPGLPGVTVTLKGPGLPAAGATAITNALGEYYFSNVAGTVATGYVYSLTGLTSGGSYSLTFPTSVSAGALTLSTKPNSATGANADNIDSDADATGLVSFTLGNSGENNFTYDAAFVSPPCGLTLALTPGLCLTATNSFVLSGTVTATSVPSSGTLSITSGAFTPRSLTLPAGNSTGTLSYSGLVSNGQTYTVTASYSNSACTPVSQTFTAPVSCSVAPCSLTATTTQSICNPATNTYSTTAVVRLTNPTAGTLTVTDGAQSTTFVTTAASSGTFTAVFNGLTSNGSSHTVTASLPGCSTTATTYTAPASCSTAPVCSISAVATASVCNTATNTYSSTVVVTVLNPTAGTLTVTNRGASQTFSTTANAQNSFTAVFAGLISDGQSYTTTASLPGCGSASTAYTAPASCSATPACSLSAVATPGACASATNTFTNVVRVTLTNPTAGTLTVTDGVMSVTFAVPASTGTTTTSASFSGIVSNGASHTVVVTLPGCGSTVVTYTAPASCSAGLPATAALGDYVFADNNKNGIQDAGDTPIPGVVVVLLDGTNTPIRSTTTNASGLYSFTGLTPGVPYSVSFVTPAGYTSTSAQVGIDDTKDSDADPVTGKTRSVTLASGENNPNLDAGFYIPTAGLGDFIFEDTNKNGQQDPGEPGIPNVTVTLLNGTSVVSTTTTNGSGFYAFTGLTPGTPYSVSFTAPANYTATLQNIGNDATDSDGDATGLTGVYSLTAGEFNPTVDMGYFTAPASTSLTINKVVSSARATQGAVLSYTVVLTNVGTTSATNVTVRDVSTTGLTYVPNSASAPTGTVFTSGTPTSTWSVPSIAAGQSLTLTFQARADSSGILYNTATIPGDTARVCTSVPVIVCAGDTYLFRLTAAPGRSSYRWFRNDVEIVGQTTNVLDVTAPGTYSLAVDNVTGLCPDFSCCPFIIEEAPLPTYQAVATPATCVGSTPQTNGRITLSGFQAGNTYQYSLGTSFNPAASLSGPEKAIPTGGVIVSNLANPTSSAAYTVRVYNASGCFTDVTVILTPTVCNCPPEVCVPLVIRQTRGPRR